MPYEPCPLCPDPGNLTSIPATETGERSRFCFFDSSVCERRAVSERNREADDAMQGCKENTHCRALMNLCHDRLVDGQAKAKCPKKQFKLATDLKRARRTRRRSIVIACGCDAHNGLMQEKLVSDALAEGRYERAQHTPRRIPSRTWTSVAPAYVR